VAEENVTNLRSMFSPKHQSRPTPSGLDAIL